MNKRNGILCLVAGVVLAGLGFYIPGLSVLTVGLCLGGGFLMGRGIGLIVRGEV